MKIIAKTDNGCLIEASMDEVAKLQGYDGAYDSEYRSSVPSPHIGYEIDITGITGTAKYVRTLDDKVLAQSHERLLNMAERLSGVRDLVHKLNLFEDLKKQDVEEPA